MERISQLNDLDYCYASWELLKELEKNSYLRNEQTRNFQEESSKQQFFVIGVLSIIPSLFIWCYLVFSKKISYILSLKDSFSKFGLNLVSLIMISIFLFILVYLLLGSLWSRPMLSSLKRLSEKKLKKKLDSNINIIDAKVEEIVSKSIFKEERIPEVFLCSEMLPFLIRYLESGQATIMKEAIYYLKLELTNTGYYDNLIPSTTLLQREKEYLNNKKMKERGIKRERIYES